MTRVWLFVSLLALAAAARADSWAYKDSTTAWRFANGLRVEAITDAHADGSATQYVKVFKGRKVLALLNGVGFETLVESPDHHLYVGLSNRGLPGTAAVVFDREGKLLLYASHWASKLTYCDETVTLVRRWFDDRSPDVRFDGGQITLNDCGGNRISLFESVGKALATP